MLYTKSPWISTERSKILFKKSGNPPATYQTSVSPLRFNRCKAGVAPPPESPRRTFRQLPKSYTGIHHSSPLLSQVPSSGNRAYSVSLPPKARLTKALERTILELRPHMSIQALANFYDLRWHTIKELEKKQLKKKHILPPQAATSQVKQ